ncbi:hybrid sensor histidine kinase/response regulator [Phormidium sp. CCY1219]|uniref:hybrid sensor histidine kinase/response regulator n=1 Tax=Phormidium sp. CCY1219 TaxID=2886104 RepID=UPI002D1E766E|nr:ATP-binding protein [Phormidium sp. CCY1219]MEB3830176.1 response regulator [Phormidium sp. CCY1219]
MANQQILVVEDEQIQALELQKMLENLGYQVPIAVTSGEAAIAAAKDRQLDVVLIDLNLSGTINGVSAAKQIRDRFNIPVVYLTESSDEETLQRAKLTTPFGYLVKPLEANYLKTTIEMAIYRHQLEQELKQSQQWFATTLHSIGEAVIATDAGGIIRFINPVAESITGWRRSQALGKDVSEVFCIVNPSAHLPYPEAPGKHNLQLAEGNEISLENIDEPSPVDRGWTASCDRLLIAKDGRQIPIDDTVAPINDENNKIIGAVYVFRDISARQQTEALEKERIRLETEIKERSLAEAEIRRSLELEKELSELKSRLITTISHEFRTPMSVILSSSELLQVYGDGWQEEKKQTHFNRIETAIEYMTALVEDIMLVGEAQSGKLRFNPTPVELVGFCTQLIEEMNSTKSDRHHIQWICDRQAIEVILDPKLLRQILKNLLSNAIKYSPDGGEIKLELTCHPSNTPLVNTQNAPSLLAIFRIQDPGIGIPKVETQHLFESFQRATNVGTIRGTGLGLAIVQKCVQLHGGQVELESELGIGTTVTVKLPIDVYQGD